MSHIIGYKQPLHQLIVSPYMNIIYPYWPIPGERNSIIWTGPLLASDRLIIAGSHGKAMAISPYTGRFLGTVEMPDGVSVPPVIAGGSIYFLADDAELVVYR